MQILTKCKALFETKFIFKTCLFFFIQHWKDQIVKHWFHVAQSPLYLFPCGLLYLLASPPIMLLPSDPQGAAGDVFVLHLTRCTPVIYTSALLLPSISLCLFVPFTSFNFFIALLFIVHRLWSPHINQQKH